MKKLVLKTAIITFVVVLVLAVAAFGIASLSVPAAMSDLTYSLGMESVSSDYAYQEYTRSRDLNYLARSFELSAARGRDDKAEDRFEELYGAEGFEEMCSARDEKTPSVIAGVRYSYRDYVIGLGACVKYRLAATPEELGAAIDLAFHETAAEFPQGNPAYTLAVEAAGRQDSAFCAMLITAFDESSFDKESELYQNLYNILVNILEVTADEQNH